MTNKDLKMSLAWGLQSLRNELVPVRRVAEDGGG